MAEPLRLVLLGDPVAHSRSPAIQTVALSEAGLEGEYRAIKADVQALGQAMEQLRDGSLSGANVTMPLKEPAYRMADRLTPVARSAGSVNSLRSRDRVVEAHTTDAVAFREILEDENRFAHDSAILVLGSGGSARAILAVSGNREVWISARSEAKANSLCTEFGTAGVIPWGVGLAGSVVVNATPIGMKGEHLPDEVTDGAGGLIDLPYGAEQTPAVRQFCGLNLPLVDGVEFLARQARASFEWWTGKPVDLQPLIEAARNV